MTLGPKLNRLVEYVLGAAGWKPSMEQFLRTMDSIVQLTAKGIVNAPPTSSAGDTWVVGSTPTGVFAGQIGGTVATWQPDLSQYQFDVPKRGWWGMIGNDFMWFDGTSWQSMSVNPGMLAAIQASQSAVQATQNGTISGAGAPTAAPTAANPATCLVNGNQEVFRWNPTNGWKLAENPLTVALPNSSVIRSINIGYTVEKTFVCPRAGVVQAFARWAFGIGTTPAAWNNSEYNFQCVLDSSGGGGAVTQVAEYGILGTVSGPSLGRSKSISSQFTVSAGDVIQLFGYVQVSNGTGNVDIESNLQVAYIK